MWKKGGWSLLLVLMSGCRFEYVSDDLYIGYGECPDRDRSKRECETLINRIRGEGRYCGANYYPAAPLLVWDERIETAARNHSQDMAQYDFIDHLGSDGSSVELRLQNAGYPAQTAAENLGGGYSDPKEAFTAWLNSPLHCANLMGKQFQETGCACAGRKNSQYGTYWTLVLGTI